MSGLYIFTKKYSNPQLYLQDYSKFKKLLTEKYGKPVGEEQISAINNPEIHNSGQAVADGNLQFHAVWNTERSVIKITLITVDKQPNLQIHYTARTLDELESPEDLKAALGKL